MVLILSVITGFGGGFAVSAGVFALITALSLLPRMADKTRTASFMKSYETCVLLGGMSGVAMYFLETYDHDLSLYRVLEPVLGSSVLWRLVLVYIPISAFGIFIGIFVGTLAVSIAENLNVTAVLGRRAKLHYGLGCLILSFAIGKSLGAFVFFFKQWF